MRRFLEDSILKAFDDHAKQERRLDQLPDSTPVQLIVRFSLGDLRWLQHSTLSSDTTLQKAVRVYSADI